jgi:DNA-binding MarR family transcriptional regulator
VARKISLPADELDVLRRLAWRLAPTADEVRSRQKVSVEVVEPDELAELARRIMRSRSNRTKHFAPAMFGEPAWDMLLALYIAAAESKRLSVTQLTSFSGSPQATALRWLEYLSKQELVAREPHSRDGRVYYIDLTDKGRSALNDYLTAIRKLFR